MKPHQMRIEAFGPYAEPVEIDFDALGQEGLFLIHGTTGAGKTFLLDALCFALYGEVSGDRSVKALKSDHAAASAVPRVSLAFSCGGARYRVERSPAHTAPKLRGEGTTEKAPQAVLFRLLGSGPEPLASRSVEVTREVEGLVGLDAAQFRQVILLPQGRFAEVLRARAEEREALLRTLFDTVVFEQAGFWLDEKAKAARGEVAEQNRAQEVLRRQAAHEWSPHAPAAAEDGDGPHDQADLERLVERIGAVVAGAATGLRQATASLEVALRAKAEIERLADRWDRRAAASARLTELEGKQEVVEAYRLRLARAAQAEVLRPSMEAERSAREALRELEAGIRARLLQAIRARDGAQALPVSVVLLDLMVLPGLQELAAAGNDLAARRAELAALARKAQEADQARARAAEAAARARLAEEQRHAAAAALEGRQRQRQAAAEAFTRACTARDQLDGLRRAAQEARDRAAAAQAIGPAQASENGAIAARNRADRQVNACTAELNERRRRQIAGMAARLAGDLAPAAPCPVCGSTHHPAPAPPSPDPVGEEEIAVAERAVDGANQAARAAAEAEAQARAALAGWLEKAGPAAGDPDGARLAAREAAAALKAAAEQAAALESLEQAIGEHDRQIQRLEAAIQEASTAIALQSRAVLEDTGRAEALAAELARELGEGVDPQAALTTFAPLEAALKALALSAEAHTGATTRLEQASGRLATDLAASPFATAEEAAAALEAESWRRDLAERIAAFEKELIELRGVLAAPDLAQLPPERPDTAAAQQAVSAADAARTAAVERHSEARGAQVEIERLAEEHRRGEASLAERRERAQLLSAVADRCQGRAAPFISLQRWVLSAYLADICRHANQRLELMTSGRYQLRLTDEGGRGGRQAGLGLRVLDAYTGEEREVSSLSGGETFQASLALALGVADTVQAHTGGVHLDALFIDEGFGSLDPDNLQLAMDELDRLREGGRLIGIISHVGALRERIRCGIEVVASDQGSTVRVGSTALA